MRRDPTDDTRNGLANVLRGRNEQAAGQQQDRREHIMQPKHRIINLHLLILKILPQSTE